MADSDEKEAAIVNSDSAKSPEDLESEIAATAAALGGKSKKEREAAVTDTQDNEPNKAAQEPEKEDEPQEKPADNEEPAEDGSQKIQVNRKTPQPEETEDEEAKTDSESEAAAPAEEKTTMIHSGKTIQPLKGKPAEKSDSSEESAGDAESDKETPKEQPPTAKTEDDSEEKSEAARKLDAMSGELKVREKEKQVKTSESEQQAAKVYDTKKYHLPIKAGHHHRKSMMPTWLQILVLVLALAGAAYYAYATDLISFGGSGSFLDEQADTTLEERPVSYTNNTGVSVINLLASAESIGLAEARVSVLYGNHADSPIITFNTALEQNQGGNFWLLSDDKSLEAVNAILEESGAGERELATKQQTLDFIDVYGFSTLISDSSVGSLNGILKNLNGSEATTCQSAIDSAIVAMSTDEFMQQKLEKVNPQSVNINRNGQELEAETFTLKGAALDEARRLLVAAIDACAQSDAKNQELKSSLWQPGDIAYKVVDSEEHKIVRVENTKLERTVLDIELSNIAEQKSDASPERTTNFNSPVAWSLAAAKTCGEPATVVDINDASYELNGPSSDAYQAIIGADSAFVCSNFDPPSNENLLKNANQLISLRSVVETAKTAEDGYPAPSQADSVSTDVDSWIPSLGSSVIFDYSLTPNGCGDGQVCTGYQLQLAG